MSDLNLADVKSGKIPLSDLDHLPPFELCLVDAIKNRPENFININKRLEEDENTITEEDYTKLSLAVSEKGGVEYFIYVDPRYLPDSESYKKQL